MRGFNSARPGNAVPVNRRSARRSLFVVPLLAVTLTLAVAAPAFGAAGVLDQSQTTVNNSAQFTYALHQTFTAGVTGRLDSVSLFPVGDGMDFAFVSITDVSAGVPGFTELAGAGVDEVGVGSWVDIPFATPAVMTAGTAYAINVFGFNELGTSQPGGYAGGQAFGTILGFGQVPLATTDLAFKTLVTPETQPDASIRLGSGSYVGENIVLPLEQAVNGTGDIGDKLTFWIKIKNAGALADSFKVKRSSGFTNGYRVRYYNAAGRDVTGQVTVGSFTTPSLDNGEAYVMRATVKVRSLATEGSLTSRLITVSSVNAPALKDAVRFTASLAAP